MNNTNCTSTENYEQLKYGTISGLISLVTLIIGFLKIN